VLVDEIQDLSPLQLGLVRSLLSASGDGFFGIGDPCQSIYGFRGAHGDCLDFFRQSWPNLDVISLLANYRSRKGIVDASGALPAAAAAEAGAPAPVSLQALRREPALMSLFAAPSADAEAIWVAERAARLRGTGSHSLDDADSASRNKKHGNDGPGADHSPGDIAILVRAHALASVYRKALARKGIPVSEPAADVFWEDERVDIIIRAAGRMLGIAPSEIPDEAVVPECPDKIFANGPLGVAAYLVSCPPFDEAFWASAPFHSLVRAYDANGGWAGLITWINLKNELERVRAKGEKVQVLSLHAAKGLEFRTVFLPALEDGLLPFAGPELLTGKLPEKQAGLNALAEERRLLYVGMTRARDYLYLSHAERRSLYGRELRLRPSRFLEALPLELFTRSALVAHTSRREERLSLL
jgi:superfamily I DNA/RNA helicase